MEWQRGAGSQYLKPRRHGAHTHGRSQGGSRLSQRWSPAWTWRKVEDGEDADRRALVGDCAEERDNGAARAAGPVRLGPSWAG